MKELFDNFKTKDISEVNGKVLVDTCAFIYVISNAVKLKRFSKCNNIAMTSFNVQELIHVSHKLSKIKHVIRSFLKDHDFTIVDIGVSPGNKEKEILFVNSVDEEILKHCKDPSDAVLLAAAVVTKSDIFTKDKHHIFTGSLKNYFDDYGIRIMKELKEIEKN